MLIRTLVLVACVGKVLGLNNIVELWSTEHLLDLIQSDALRFDAPATRPAVVALYEPQCESTLRNMHFTAQSAGREIREQLPSANQLLLAVFNRAAARDVWYEWIPEQMDAFEFFNASVCPTVVFQSPTWNQSVVYSGAQTEDALMAWVWRMLEMAVHLDNAHSEAVDVSVESRGPLASDANNVANVEVAADGSAVASDSRLLATALAPAQTWNSVDAGVVLHVGDQLVIRETATHKIVNRYVMDMQSGTLQSVEVSMDLSKESATGFEDSLKDAYELSSSRDWSTRRRHLSNIRAPPLMPQFTELGVASRQLPAEVCEYITTFYRENRERMRRESFPKDGTQINADEVNTHLLSIPMHKKKWIASILKPLLEEWSGVELKFTTLYGVREYRGGATLKPHVDRMSHIVSSIIHVAHEPATAQWPLEVVALNGSRIRVQDDVCGATFYESSKLIHGRPDAFRGDAWVNAFVHFRPLDWDGKYEFTRDNVIVTPNTRVPLVDFIYG